MDVVQARATGRRRCWQHRTRMSSASLSFHLGIVGISALVLLPLVTGGERRLDLLLGHLPLFTVVGAGREPSMNGPGTCGCASVAAFIPSHGPLGRGGVFQAVASAKCRTPLLQGPGATPEVREGQAAVRESGRQIGVQIMSAAKAKRRAGHAAAGRVPSLGLKMKQVEEQELAQLEELRDLGYNRNAIMAWAARRPVAVSNRLFECVRSFYKVKRVWEREAHLPAQKRTRGQLLRSELSKIGPVAVKVGQTLSQRPDIIAEDVCEELKGLQTTNTPFPNDLAWKVIADELNWKGAIAPGLPLPAGFSSEDKTLFAALNPEPIASASLGQVYRATTHEGCEVAIKVQRPTALRQCMLDAACFIGTLKRVEYFWGNGDLLLIVDEIASGILQELDFRNEARNAVEFGNSLAHLGYVRVPRTVDKYSVGPRVLVSEWIYGRHLKDLTKQEQLRLCAMSVEAVTAGLVLTGIVHADPHEGNLMLDDDGRLVFLDFGLMSTVKDEIMEEFARGIQAVLNKDWRSLMDAFQKTGFFGDPILYRPNKKAPWVAADKRVVIRELAAKMETQEGGLSRFGALSGVLFEMSEFYREYTPPYVLLLIRTFLTLEGVAGQVDPTFNIYEAALPWAIQRALSPSTPGGAQTLRSTLLDGDNKVQWQRFEQLIQEAATNACNGSSTRGSGTGDTSRVTGGVTPLDSIKTVMASPAGTHLRRIAKDVDSPALLLKLAAPSSRAVRRLAVDVLASAIASQESDASIAAAQWPLNELGAALRHRRLQRLSCVLTVLLRSHVQQLVAAGWRGVAAMSALMWLTLRIGIAALMKVVWAKWLPMAASARGRDLRSEDSR